MPTLLEWLVQKYPNAKRQTLREVVSHGRVSINGRRAKNVKELVGEADRVAVGKKLERPRASIEPLKIIHEDEDVLVVNKPPGLLTSTTVRERRGPGAEILRNYLARPGPRAGAGGWARVGPGGSGDSGGFTQHATGPSG